MSRINLANIINRQEPEKLIQVRPDFYDVIDVKNPYMKGEFINHLLANAQWQSIHNLYNSFIKDPGILKEVVALEGGKDLEDMVFCANQSLPWLDDDGNGHVILSNMRHDSRKREVPYFEQFYATRGYTIHTIDESILLEGMGDCIFHPFKKLLWMGYGFRTSIETAAILESVMKMPVIPLKLVSEYFYHLDTCFLPANDKTVFLCKEAFDLKSLELIHSIFENVIDISKEAATQTFELNTHCLYHKEFPTAVCPKGDHTVKMGLLKLGYKVFEVETSEFIKGGGSVFCMKMMFH